MTKTSILLVKEADLLREELTEALAKARYQVCLAAESAEALHLLRRHHFDCILADLQLPAPTCLALLSEARSLDPTIGFLCLKRDGDDNAVREALRRGADDFLLPPYDLQELLFRIALCLEKRAFRLSAQRDQILTACSACKKVRPRATADIWLDPETLLAEEFHVTLSHGLCPACSARLHAKIDQFGTPDR